MAPKTPRERKNEEWKGRNTPALQSVPNAGKVVVGGVPLDRLGDDLRCIIRTDNDGITGITTLSARHTYVTQYYSADEVRQLVRALEDSQREPMTTFSILNDK